MRPKHPRRQPVPPHAAGALLVSFALLSAVLASIIVMPEAEAAGSTITFVAAASYTSVGSAVPSATVSKPAGTTQGDVMIAGITTEKGTLVSITPPTGWVLIHRQNTVDKLAMATYYKIAGAAEPGSYAWTFQEGASNINLKTSGAISTYRGVNPSTPVTAAVGGGSSTAGTSIVAPTITTTDPGQVMLAYFGVFKSVDFTGPSSMTARASPKGDVSMRGAEEARPTAGATGTRTATASQSAEWISQTLALRPAPAAATALVLSGDANDLVRGISREFTATIKDSAGDTVSWGAHSTLAVIFEKTAGDGAVTGLGTVTASAGVAKITLTGDVAGNITIRARITSPAMTSDSLSLAVTTLGISGSIHHLDGRPMAGVLVEASGGFTGNATTGVDGSYTITGLAHGDHEIVLTPAAKGRSFLPESRTIAGPMDATVVDQDFNVTTDAPTAPYLVPGDADGSVDLRGVTDLMEYSLDNGTTWIPVPENATSVPGIPALHGDEVLVRYKATQDAPESASRRLVVGGYKVTIVADPFPRSPIDTAALFAAVVEGGRTPYTYAWKIRGQTYTDPSISHNFTKLGSYRVEVIVTDARNISVSHDVLIHVFRPNSMSGAAVILNGATKTLGGAEGGATFTPKHGSEPTAWVQVDVGNSPAAVDRSSLLKLDSGGNEGLRYMAITKFGEHQEDGFASVRIQFNYTALDIDGYKVDSLGIWYWNGTTWLDTRLYVNATMPGETPGQDRFVFEVGHDKTRGIVWAVLDRASEYALGAEATVSDGGSGGSGGSGGGGSGGGGGGGGGWNADASGPGTPSGTPSSFDRSAALTVRAATGGAMLSWSLPSVDGVQGFQVWRSTSPWVLVAELGPTATSYFDPDAPAGAKYKVTYFTGPTIADGYVTDPAQLAALPGWNAQVYGTYTPTSNDPGTRPDLEGPPTALPEDGPRNKSIAWIALAILLGLAVVVAGLALRRQSDS